MNKEKLRERCYEMGNSQLPLDAFFNDIRDNKAPNFNKAEAYADLEKIVDYIAKLQDENRELRKSIKSWNENAGNQLREILKLKNVIDILVDELDIKLVTSIFADELGDYYLEFKIDTNKRILRKITKEKYELLKEVLGNGKEM